MNITKETNDLVCIPHKYVDENDVCGLSELCDGWFGGGGWVVGKGVAIVEISFEKDMINLIKRYSNES